MPPGCVDVLFLFVVRTCRCILAIQLVLMLSSFGGAAPPRCGDSHLLNVVIILADDVGYGDLTVMARRRFELHELTAWLLKVCEARISLSRPARAVLHGRHS
jgi:hypothetical protein